MHAEGSLKAPDWAGKRHSEETKKKISIKASKKIGELNSQYGTCWIYKLEFKKSIKIKKIDLEKYLNDGWIVGRIMNFDKKQDNNNLI
jgi:hypothetical protein